VYLEDVHLPLLASPLRYVGERKLVGQGVDDAALGRCQRGGKRHAVAFGRLLEEQELRVELEHLGVIKINI
jgi:hypothetical protein